MCPSNVIKPQKCNEAVTWIFFFFFPVKEVSEQSQELLRKALEEAQTELSRKFKIIREIHAIESISRIKCKNFDDTEVKRGTRFIFVMCSTSRYWPKPCWLDCRSWAAGRDVPGRAEGASGSAEGGAAGGAGGQTPAHTRGETQQETNAPGAVGHHPHAQESPGTRHHQQVSNILPRTRPSSV